MIKWLIIGPKERPHLSSPTPTEYPENYTTYKQVGISIQNMPYDGMLKRWIRRKVEEIVAVTFEVINESGDSVTSGQRRFVGGIPPTGPYESGIRDMQLFGKHEDAETASAILREVGTRDISLGRHQLKLAVYNSEERATNYVADLVVTKDLKGFKIENIKPRNE